MNILCIRSICIGMDDSIETRLSQEQALNE